MRWWWKPQKQKGSVDADRAERARQTTDDLLAEARARGQEVDKVTDSLLRHSNAFAEDVEAAFRRRRPT